MDNFINLFSYFIIYSFLGWICEIIWLSIQNKKILKNTGFLYGPWCPIYGIGALIILHFLGKYQNDLIALFVISMIVCTILEYVVGWLLEKLFNERWWDYSNMKYNIEGRVCLLNTVAFGVGALILVHYLNPFFVAVINALPNNVHFVLVTVLFIAFVFDIVMTLIGVLNLRTIINKIKRRRKKQLFVHGTQKYADELFDKQSEFTLFNIRHLLKRFPKLIDPKDKDIGKILKRILTKKK